MIHVLGILPWHIIIVNDTWDIKMLMRLATIYQAATMSSLPSPDRPQWNDKFHNLEQSRAEMYNLKKSGISEKVDMPLIERMHR